MINILLFLEMKEQGRLNKALWFAEWFGKEKKLKNQIFFIVYA